MTPAEVQKEAARIIQAGNRWTIPAAELHKVPEQDRPAVWREIVRQGAEADAAEE